MKKVHDKLTSSASKVWVVDNEGKGERERERERERDWVWRTHPMNFQNIVL